MVVAVVTAATVVVGAAAAAVVVVVGATERTRVSGLTTDCWHQVAAASAVVTPFPSVTDGGKMSPTLSLERFSVAWCRSALLNTRVGGGFRPLTLAFLVEGWL